MTKRKRGESGKLSGRGGAVHHRARDPPLLARILFCSFCEDRGLLPPEIVRGAFGHSMGSCISRLMITDSGDKLWFEYFGKSPEKVRLSPETTKLVTGELIFRHRPEVDRVIFISGPHRGSEIASNWLGRLGSRLVNVPGKLIGMGPDALEAMVTNGASMKLGRIPSSVDTLAPNNRFVMAINTIPITPGIPYHSIMGDRGKGGNKGNTPPVSSDGVRVPLEQSTRWRVERTRGTLRPQCPPKPTGHRRGASHPLRAGRTLTLPRNKLMHYDPIYLVIMGVAMLISNLVGGQLKRKFAQYSQEPMPVTGREIAERMLRENGITDVQVRAAQGMLTDHYDPAGKTVNLSEPVYGSATVAAAAVAAHECGHAVQHAKKYPMLAVRSGLVPVVQIGSKLAPIVLMAGLALAFAGGSPLVLLAGILLFAGTTLFAFVTLPVEFDASRRALAWLDSSGATQGGSHKQAKDALFWAAMTYVVGALASLGQLLYYVMRFLQVRGRRQ